MKTLDEIINRQDYTKANRALENRAGELAKLFAGKMYELGIMWDDKSLPKYNEKVVVNRHVYSLYRRRSYLNGEYYDSKYYFVRLTYREGGIFGDFCADKHSFGGDASLYIPRASGELFVQFLNDAKDILAALDKMETNKVNEIAKAIEKAKDVA